MIFLSFGLPVSIFNFGDYNVGFSLNDDDNFTYEQCRSSFSRELYEHITPQVDDIINKIRSLFDLCLS